MALTCSENRGNIVKNRNRIKPIDYILILLAAICLGLALCPYSVWKGAGDSLASDGNLERFTPSFVNILRICSAAAVILFSAIVLWQVFSADSRTRFFHSIGRLPGRCVHDANPFFTDLFSVFKPKTKDFCIFLFIFLAGTVVRLLQLAVPLKHDEAYSMAMWARSDIMFAISDYHLPNNHVFNSFLMNLVYHTLGKSPALLRLPVFISGCLTVMAIWLLSKLFYKNKAVITLTAAGLTAFAPYLISYSVNARGYEIQAFLSVLTVGLAVYGKRHRNIFAWFLLIIFSALNFFTLPIALYPFGGICLWLFLNVLFFKPTQTAFRSRVQLLKYLIFMGICVSLLSLLLYVPLFRYSGLDSFFGNIYIGGTEASSYGDTMMSRLKDSVQAFSGSLPHIVVWCIAAGLLASPFLFRKNSDEDVSYGAALILWISFLIPFQRPNLWPRTVLFLHPFLLMFAASGWSGLRLISGFRRISVYLFGVLVASAGISQLSEAVKVYDVIGPDEQAVRLILEREKTNAGNIHFVTAAQDNAPLWVYADAYGLPRKIFDKRETFNTVYAFVNPLNDAYQGPKTLDDLLERFGPGKNFMILDYSEILMEEPNAILYRFEGREGAIRKAYGAYPALIEEYGE